MKILYLTNHQPLSEQFNDYMSDLLLHGLRQKFNNDVIDFPGSWYLYKDESTNRELNLKNLWGKGFTIRNILSNYKSIDREDITSKIKNRYFDLIIYASIRRSKPFINEVIKYNNKFIFIDGEDDQFIDHNVSKLGLYFKRELTEIKKNLLPINFAIPKEKILKEINKDPQNLLAPLIPGRLNTYIYKNEESYYKMYAESVFALTYKKAGWDALRHYEILMNGCLPLFLNFEDCPIGTMNSFPKDDVLKIKKKYESILSNYFPTNIYKFKFLTFQKFLDYIFSKKMTINNFLDQEKDIFELKSNLLNFTRENLTTIKLADYVIDSVKKIKE